MFNLGSQNKMKVFPLNKALFKTFVVVSLLFSIPTNAETPWQEGARVQNQLEEQRLEPVIPTEITIDQYLYQMRLEKQLRMQQQQIYRMQNQVDQLRGSNQEYESP